MKINGSLVFDSSSASEIQNLRVQKYASALPSYTAGADSGRLVYLVSGAQLYYGSDVANDWVAMATGGSAFSQAEGDAIEASLGSGVNSSGVFVPGSFTLPNGVTATNFTQAINTISSFVTGHDALSELLDVNTGTANASAADKDFLRYDTTSGKWMNHTLVLADNTDVTTTSTELNQLHSQGAVAADFAKLHGITTSAAQINNATATTATTTELNYVSGVTSSIQTQLNAVQAGDAGLTSFAALTGPGFVTVDSTGNVVSARNLVAPAAGITISSTDGSGNPTFALANDLAAYEGLTTTGYVIRTGDGSAIARSINGVSGNTVVTNGNGVSSDTSIDIAPITQASSGNFVKVTLDGFGRVTGNTAVTTLDITALADGSYVNVGGDTMTGPLVMATGTHITLTDAAVNANDAVNKAYVDALSQGLSWKQAVKAASTTTGGNLSLTGLGALDGVTIADGDRVLVKNQTTGSENGIYIAHSGSWVRASDMDAPAEFEGATVLVQEGTTQADFGYTQTKAVSTIGDSVAFVQFTGSSVLTAGTGLLQSANVLSVNMGAGIAELPAGEVGIDLYDVPNGALILTTDATTHSTNAGAQLYLRLDTAGALEQTSSGLKIGAGAVVNAMLTHSTIGLNADSGTSAALALGDTFQIKGTSTQGISTALTTDTITITASDASDSQKGVAKFDTTQFSVTAGAVTLGTVPLAALAYDYTTFTGTSGSTNVALGSALSVVGATAPVKVVSSAGTLTIGVDAATSSTLGLASFDSNFTVTAGAVALHTTFGQGGITNVNALVDTAADQDLLSYDSTSSSWTKIGRTSVAGTINLGDLKDVGTAPATTAGKVLVADGTAWQAKSIYYKNTYTSSASWTVAHNLGQQFVNVTVMADAGSGTYEVVIPQSITMTDANTVVVTFNTAVAGAVAVMGVA